VSDERHEGAVATWDERTYPDWERRLLRAERESKQAKGVELASRESPRGGDVDGLEVDELADAGG
jgi:hypothetical protein